MLYLLRIQIAMNWVWAIAAPDRRNEFLDAFLTLSTFENTLQREAISQKLTRPCHKENVARLRGRIGGLHI